MTTKMMCPNCAGIPAQEHPQNGCVLAALIEVVRDRGEMSATDLAQLLANTDADALWNDLGPIVDTLEAGGYTQQESAQEKQHVS